MLKQTAQTPIVDEITSAMYRADPYLNWFLLAVNGDENSMKL
jgi:hypothetical protein